MKLSTLLSFTVITLTASLAGAQEFDNYSAEVNGREVYLQIGEDVETVYGIVMARSVSFGAQEFARTMGFASAEFSGPPRPEGIAGVNGEEQYAFDLLEAIRQIADESGHPELANAPFAWFGFSDGGSSGNAMASVVPERMIAVANNDGAINIYDRYDVPVTDEIRNVPFYFCGRENTEGWREFVEAERSRGALWAQAFIHTRTEHSADGRCWPMLYHFLEQVVHARYPRDAVPVANADLTRSSVTLLPIAEDTGWLVSHNKSEASPAIAAFGDWAGDRASASWLPNETLAIAHQSTAAWNREGPLTPYTVFEEYRGRQRLVEVIYVDAGEIVTWDIEEPSVSWSELRVMDGDQVVATLSPGDPLRVNLTFSEEQLGAHFLFLQASAGGETVTSPPQLFVVGGVGVPWGPDSVPPIVMPDAGPTSDAGPGFDGGPTFDAGPTPDANIPMGPDGGVGGDSAVGSDAGAGADPGGCRASPRSGSSWFGVAMLLFVIAGQRRRRS